MRGQDPFGARGALETADGTVTVWSLETLEKRGVAAVSRLPISIKVLLEAALRQADGFAITEESVEAIARWGPDTAGKVEIPFKPARVILQDFTGVPSLVDLAAMRSALARLGGESSRINPVVPVDLVIDHSVQVDRFGTAGALAANAAFEFDRNRERYMFLKWGERAFRNFRVVPPATGIVHQVNLEYLARVVRLDGSGTESATAYPDSLVGTDSHTTMINGLGVVGWGVGGIEAEAAMLGQPIYMLLPEVIGVRFVGELPPGANATDLVLTVTEMLRKKGVVGKFVEFCGPGLDHLSLPDRATIANMSPEYGATIGFFPVDGETLRYLTATGRDRSLVDLVSRYTREQGMFRSVGSPEPVWSDVVEMDLAAIRPSLSGPKRPQDRFTLEEARERWRSSVLAPVGPGGYGVARQKADAAVRVEQGGVSFDVRHGHVAIAAITSCTNTSNPVVLVGAGLLARNAVKRGLFKKPWVKTSLAPGSKVVMSYLEAAGLVPYLEALGFHLVGFGCTTCIGNSGPLPGPIHDAIAAGGLVTAAVLSGNRNFEGRINPDVQASFLASPPLVVAYAIAGTMDIDLHSDPIGHDGNGEAVYLKDIWPSPREVETTLRAVLRPEMFNEQYKDVFTGNPAWNAVPVSGGEMYEWDPKSMYIVEPPFFERLGREAVPVGSIRDARVLAILPDSTTTDHISPAGAIEPGSPAAEYLESRGVARDDWNSYGSRRGNHEVMMRGTFANIRIKNRMVPGVEGGTTVHVPTGEKVAIFEASRRYLAAGMPLVILAGKEYGSGSSRDWAAKGPMLLGVRAVIAESFERIHRSNLVGMGVLPLQFMPGETVASLGLTGREAFEISGISDAMGPGAEMSVRVAPPGGPAREFRARSRIDTPVEVEYYKHGGILQAVLEGIRAETR